ncbi:Transcriptional regulator, TetR family [Elusimicrobium minutum Pei191]|uniref:Transcriptional regulator, TetR family n=1 Tax=Elusimicrobium minutum (strain Pei191) TaxID=445932 RepID=B2KDJ8_ELUMP|nr:TetR family transcriptional regulator [Elusimicrobium minutum]ACC98594.1 Transcriptional regulator, TetR family [Elusimicrobium minutum Pei191]
MGRTSSGNDTKLIKTGLELAKKNGLGGFSVRQLCAKSKVNLGMFHYYFGTKDNFDKVILNEIYQTMILRMKTSLEGTPEENTRKLLYAVWDFIAENRILLSSLAGDVFSGNKNIIKYISENFTEHIFIMLGELEKAHKNKQLNTPSAADALILIIPPLALPNILFGLAERVDIGLLNKLKSKLISLKADMNQKRRIDMLINLVFKREK